MSLVSGLLTHTCTVKRPQFDTDDNITGYLTVNTNVDILITQKNTVLTTGDGGREVVTTLIAIMEYADESQITVNDVIVNVINNSTGIALQESLNGGPLQPRSFKVTGNNDPNFLDDHLELPVESFHGRIEGQP